MVRLAEVSRALAQLEARVERWAPAEEPAWECWVSEWPWETVKHGRTGQELTRAEFDARFPDARHLTIDLGTLGPDRLADGLTRLDDGPGEE